MNYQNVSYMQLLKYVKNNLYVTNIYSVSVTCQVVEKVNSIHSSHIFFHFSAEDTFHTSILFHMLLITFTQNLISKMSHVLLCLKYQSISAVSLLGFVSPIEPVHLGRTWPYPILFFFVPCHSPTTELRGDARVCLDDLAIYFLSKEGKKESK